jgi:hypothetical protein
MTIELTWQAVGLLATLAATWSGFLIAIIHRLLTREISNIDGKIALASAAAEGAAGELQKHRVDCLQFRAQLPIDYFRREDMIRFETLTHAKLDAMATDVRQLECRKCQHKAQ